MRRFLFIHFFAHQQQVDWAVFNSQGHILESATQVSLETVPHHNYPTWVLVPGMECLLTSTRVPSRHRQKIIQAVPFVLEESLAEDVEHLHFALGQRKPHSEFISVAVMARSRLDDYLQRLNSLKIVPRVLIPDVLAIPKPSDGWGIAVTEQTFLIRTGEESGFAIDATPHYFKYFWEKALQEEEPPKQFLISRSHRSLSLQNLKLDQYVVKENICEQGELSWLVQGILSSPHSLNLLQGIYCPRQKTTHLLRPWRLTFILLALWGGLYLIQQGVNYQKLQQKHHDLEINIEKVYRETFPQAHKIVNPRIQMEQYLTALRNQTNPLSGNEDFLTSFVQIAPFLKTQDLRLESLDYRQGSFDLQLEVSTWQVLETLKNHLTKLGFTVKVQSATHRNHQKIESRIHIQK